MDLRHRFQAPGLPLLLAPIFAFALSIFGADKSERNRTVLAVDDARFTLNGVPAFLLGFSYYGGLGASEDFIKQDLEDFQRHGFNWLRVWATWEGFGNPTSAFDSEGKPQEPYFGKLRWLLSECDRRGMVVDVTLARQKLNEGQPPQGLLPNFAAHQRAIEGLCSELKPYRNWYLDLANERDVRDRRFVPPDELKLLRERVRQLDPARLVTASFGGHDLDRSDLQEAIAIIGVDFLAPHRPRHPSSPAETEAQTRACLELMRELGRVVPLHHQEPFRRGYQGWAPAARDFLTDLRGAVAGGAAGWCFHNGSQRGGPQEEPRRSFDLRSRRLWTQLDVEERAFVEQARAALQK